MTSALTSPGRRPLQPVSSVSRRDVVLKEIRRAVVVGTIKPGDKLTEAQLSEWLSISRPTIREALNQLTLEGLLIQEPYKALRVASLSKGMILALARTRLALDIAAADDICADATGRRMEMLEAAWEEFRGQEFNADPVIKHEAHVAFHRAIWAASENDMLLRLWPVMEAHLTIALAQDQILRNDPVRAHDVHEHLVDALRTRNRAVIEDAFSAHTLESARELAALLEQQEGA